MITFAVCSLVAASLLSILFTFAIKRIAIRRNWVGHAMPHHFHDGPVPRLGGISIFISVLTLTSVLAFLPAPWSMGAAHLVYIFVAGSLVFGIGLWDDFSPIAPLLKAILEILAGVILFMGHIRVESIPAFSSAPLPQPLSLILTIVWVLGITNAFNLIDGLDGLAAGSAFISSLSLAVLFTIGGHPELAIFAMIIAGSLAGFLKFNFSPAAIFLGDCGSLFVGFLMSALGLLLLNSFSSPVASLLPLLAFGLPVMDTALAIVRRILKNQPIYMPDCEHMHHQLIARGHSVARAAMTLYVISAFFGVVAVALVSMPAHAVLLLTLPIGCVTGCFIGFGYHKYSPELQQFRTGLAAQKPFIVDGDKDPETALRARGMTARQRKTLATIQEQSALNGVVAGHRGGQSAGVAFSDD